MSNANSKLCTIVESSKDIYDFYVTYCNCPVARVYAPTHNIGLLTDYLQELEKIVIKVWKPKNK